MGCSPGGMPIAPNDIHWESAVSGTQAGRLLGALHRRRPMTRGAFHEPTRAQDQVELPANAHGFRHIAYRVTNIDAVVAQAREAGYVDGTKGDESFYDGWQEVLDSLGEHLGQSQTGR